MSNTRFARALELLGNYPFCGGTLQQTRSWIARPEWFQWGRWPLDMQVLVPDVAMASGPPIPNSECAPIALLLGAVSSVADPSRKWPRSLRVGCWLLDSRTRASGGVRIDHCPIRVAHHVCVAWDGSMGVG